MAEDFCPRISADWVGVNVLAQMALTACPCTLPDPCQNHHCKHGKVCELDENNTPMCVCQDPTSCPAPIGEFEKVSTDERGRGAGPFPTQGVCAENCGLGHSTEQLQSQSPLTRSSHSTEVEVSQRRGSACHWISPATSKSNTPDSEENTTTSGQLRQGIS